MCRRRLRSFSTLHAQCSTLNIQLVLATRFLHCALNVGRWALIFAAHESASARSADHDRCARKGAGWKNGEVIPEREAGRLYSLRAQHRKCAAVEETDR